MIMLLFSAEELSEKKNRGRMKKAPLTKAMIGAQLTFIISRTRASTNRSLAKGVQYLPFEQNCFADVLMLKCLIDNFVSI